LNVHDKVASNSFCEESHSETVQASPEPLVFSIIILYMYSLPPYV